MTGLTEKECCAHHGFLFCDCSYMNTDTLRLVRGKIEKTQALFPPKTSLDRISEDQLLAKSQELMLSFFGDMDFNVNQLNQNNLIASLPADFAYIDYEEGSRMLLKIVEAKKKIMSIFDLPIVTASNFAIETLDYPRNDWTFLQNAPICFYKIYSSSNFGELGICSLVHEYIHALTLRNKGSIENYYNMELLSIFMELVTADSLGLDVLRDMELKKINLLNTDIRRLEGTVVNDQLVIHDRKLEQRAKIYIIGTMLAESLFDLYLTGDQEEMLDDVKMVLQGQDTLETLLGDYQVSFEGDSVSGAIDTAINQRILVKKD